MHTFPETERPTSPKDVCNSFDEDEELFSAAEEAGLDITEDLGSFHDLCVAPALEDTTLLSELSLLTWAQSGADQLRIAKRIRGLLVRQVQQAARKKVGV